MSLEDLDRQIQEAATIIKAGGLVIYPTETVYGLAADPRNRIAVLKVFGAKRRPMDNPLSVAVKDLEQADEMVYLNAAVKKVARVFLPGPLTIVLRKKALLPKELTGGSDKVGIRIPGHLVALRLIELAGPITATSANISGQPAPKTAEQAREQLGDNANFVLDTGVCGSGRPSTVVDLSEQGKIDILREGNISKEMLESVLVAKK